jgi:hypothetical protein
VSGVAALGNVAAFTCGVVAHAVSGHCRAEAGDQRIHRHAICENPRRINLHGRNHQIVHHADFFVAFERFAGLFDWIGRDLLFETQPLLFFSKADFDRSCLFGETRAA